MDEYQMNYHQYIGSRPLAQGRLFNPMTHWMLALSVLLEPVLKETEHIIEIAGLKEHTDILLDSRGQAFTRFITDQQPRRRIDV